VLLSVRYRLLCGLLRVLARLGIDDRDLEIAVLRHQLKVLGRGEVGPPLPPPIGRPWLRRAAC
jgi:hypothetical protein